MNIEGIGIEYTSHYEDQLDNWVYTVGVILGDANE